MKESELPNNVTLTSPGVPGQKSISEEWSAARVLREIVMMLEWWREGNDLDRVSAFLEIDAKVLALIETRALRLVLTDKQQELLSLAMQMPNRQIGPPALNRFYMMIYSAVLNAKELPGDPEEKTEKTAADR